MLCSRLLKEANALFPGVWQKIDEARETMPEGIPGFCFLPLELWDTLAHEVNPHASPVQVNLLQAAGTWRPTQGVYKFNSDFLSLLLDTSLPEISEIDFARAFKEWCIWIEAPGLCFNGKDITGFFVFMDYSIKARMSGIYLYLSFKDFSTETFYLPLMDTLTNSIRHIRQYVIDTFGEVYFSIPAHTFEEYLEEFQNFSIKILTILLYLTSKEPDFFHQKHRSPAVLTTQTMHTKRGIRIIAPTKPTVFFVGENISKNMHSNYDSHCDTITNSFRDRKSVKLHIRRGHWHMYWTGEKRTIPVWRWIHPTLAGKPSIKSLQDTQDNNG